MPTNAREPNRTAITYAGVDADPRVSLYDGAATDYYAARHAGSPPDPRVMADLHVVVDLDVVLDDGRRHGSTLHDSQRPNLDKIADHDAAKVRNSFLIAGLIAHESETLGSDDRVCPDDGPFANGHARTYPHTGPEDGTSSN